MARVVRRRRIAAPASALWDVVTDPYHLPRWWPNTQRVENVSEGEPGERSWTQVLETRDGRGVRADYHGVAVTDGERYVFEQTVEGTPFERFVKRVRTEIQLQAAERRDRRDHVPRPPAARPLPAGLADDAQGDRADPERGARRPGDGRDRGGGTELTADMKWWGWGDPDRRLDLPPAAVAALREELGVHADDAVEHVPLEQVSLPEARPVPDAVRSAAGEVLDGPEDRLRRAAGRSYPDLVRLRTGRLELAPDAVLRPPDDAAVEAVLGASADAGVAVVPYGGGTSVVGGLDAVSDSHAAVVSLDLAHLRSVELDPRSLTAILGPGLSGPDAERALGALGATLGHFPQSFEQATIGGFAATRSAGQASSGYGRFDDVVTSIELTAPAGTAANPRDPSHRRRPGAARAGPRLGGDPRRDHRGQLPGAPGAAGAPLRGLDGGGLQGRPRDRP